MNTREMNVVHGSAFLDDVPEADFSDRLSRLSRALLFCADVTGPATKRADSATATTGPGSIVWLRKCGFT